MSDAAQHNGDTQMLSCSEVMELLWSFVDGELEAGEAVAVRGHLELCGRCYPEYDWHRAYTRFMRNVSDRMVPPGLRRRVFQALLEESRRDRG